MPGTTVNRKDDGYSSMIGAVFVFNLIVGTGALTIPAAFSDAGWVVGVVLMLVISIMSYMTTTFVIESMAAANAIMQLDPIASSEGLLTDIDDISKSSTIQRSNNFEDDDDEVTHNPIEARETTEHSNLLANDEIEREVILGVKSNLYVINHRIEMGQMASIFLHKVGVVFFYLSISIYLYGDLAIYATAVCKTLRDLTCSTPSNISCNGTIDLNAECWHSFPLSRTNAYRLYLVVFCLVIGPFVFFNVKKTMFIQVVTTVLRWLAFSTMITLALIHLTRGKGLPAPRAAHLKNLPNLFGVCVYSFMCHHSLPSLITPINKKTNVYRMMALNYLCILTFYLLLALTGVFSFENVRDLYTLNFEPDRCDPDNPDLITNSVFIQYFLLLFPVFTISPNFPIIGITLKNNLIQLFSILSGGRPIGRMLEIVALPMLTIIPPLMVSIATEELQWLVGVTGSFAGVGIQYMIPTMLVIWSRKLCKKEIGTNVKNPFQSPFSSNVWPIFALIWSIGCISFNVIRMLMNLYQRYQNGF